MGSESGQSGAERGTHARRARHPFMPSSVIRALHYDPVDHHLDLLFVSGRRYRYHEVPEETYDAMRRAFSKGEFFNAHIRDQYRFTRVN